MPELIRTTGDFMKAIPGNISDGYDVARKSVKKASGVSYDFARRNPYWTAGIVAGAVGLGYLAYWLMGSNENESTEE